MEEFIKRIEEELDEVELFEAKLFDRIERLEDFMDLSDFKKIDTKQQDFLVQQLKCMKSTYWRLYKYINVLKCRLNLLKGDK